jgi:hypothetical protein
LCQFDELQKGSNRKDQAISGFNSPSKALLNPRMRLIYYRYELGRGGSQTARTIMMHDPKSSLNSATPIKAFPN